MSMTVAAEVFGGDHFRCFHVVSSFHELIHTTGVPGRLRNTPNAISDCETARAETEAEPSLESRPQSGHGVAEPRREAGEHAKRDQRIQRQRDARIPVEQRVKGPQRAAEWAQPAGQRAERTRREPPRHGRIERKQRRQDHERHPEKRSVDLWHRHLDSNRRDYSRGSPRRSPTPRSGFATGFPRPRSALMSGCDSRALTLGALSIRSYGSSTRSVL